MLLGAVLAASLVVLLFKSGWVARLLPFHPVIDIAASLMFIAAMGNTVSGLAAALFGGLLLSGTLWFLARVIPTERLRWNINPDTGRKRLSWVTVDAPGLW